MRARRQPKRRTNQLKKNRGWLTFVAVLGIFLVLSVVMAGGMMPKDRSLTYSEMWDKIDAGEVQSVAIRGTSLWGIYKDTKVQPDQFPEQNYDFEVTIADRESFLEEAFKRVAKQRSEATGETVSPDQISEEDLDFSVIPLAPLTIPWWYELIPFIIMLVLLGGFWFLVMRSQSGGGGKVMNFGKSRARVADPSKNKVTFADVAGADEEKEELQEMVDFLRNPRNYIEMGARIPKGVLLIGPPGTGKTLLAKAVAGEAGVPFFSISGSDFVEMFVGVGASRVRDLFDRAKRAAPSIVFIDEIDAVGRHRGAGLGGGHDEREQTLNQLLVEMDGFAINEGVIVMAATNRRDILDPALLRPGRFDRTITVNYPDQEGRVAILKVHSKGKPLAADVDLEIIAKRTPFATGAELENIMNEAAILAARARMPEITHQLLMDAIARVQMGPEKRSHKVSERDRRIVAVHEGGHAIVGHMLPNADDVHLVTIVPRGQTGGHTLSLPEAEHDMILRSQLVDRIAMAMGGHAAEMVVFGEFGTGATGDLQHATDLCRRMVTQFGMSDKIGPVYLDSDQQVFVGMEFGQSRGYSEETAAAIDAEVKRMAQECYDAAVRVLTENREKLDLLVEALLKHETISRKEFVALMETGEMPEITDEGKPRSVREIMEDAAAERPEAPKDDSPEEPADGKADDADTSHDA
ncbi:MAG: ATP-dependent zinc metalloprotease FtsH [Clostridia bacterium]|nr:ATP-dependent zinc metalloprotease FtsH [Clostridia bacterium]